ncbi:MAG: hypothetical protein EXR45_05750 [Chloroflexi bacterium]|nr:hypothetical protein [Chloroflexota bacterium]
MNARTNGERHAEPADGISTIGTDPSQPAKDVAAPTENPPRRTPPHPASVRPARITACRRALDERISIGDTVTLEAGAELLRLLMSRYRGADAPLGRAIHPMTTVPLGLAIDAAIEAAGGSRLEVTTLRYSSFSMEAPTSNRRTLTAIASVTATGRRHVEVSCTVTEAERTILHGTFGLVRVVRGRASRLTDVIAAPAGLGAPNPT